VDVKITYLGQHANFIVIYRPPPSAKNGLSQKLFIDEISDFIEKRAAETSNLCIVGDFNIHIDNKNDLHTKSFLSILHDFGLTQHINQLTHNKGHTFDLVIGKANNDFIVIKQVHENLMSDHF